MDGYVHVKFEEPMRKSLVEWVDMYMSKSLVEWVDMYMSNLRSLRENH